MKTFDPSIKEPEAEPESSYGLVSLLCCLIFYLISFFGRSWPDRSYWAALSGTALLGLFIAFSGLRATGALNRRYCGWSILTFLIVIAPFGICFGGFWLLRFIWQLLGGHGFTPYM